MCCFASFMSVSGYNQLFKVNFWSNQRTTVIFVTIPLIPQIQNTAICLSGLSLADCYPSKVYRPSQPGPGNRKGFHWVLYIFSTT